MQYACRWKCYFVIFGKLIFPTLNDFCTRFYEKITLFMTDFWRSYKVLLLDKILLCGNVWQYNSDPSSVFRNVHENLFSLFNIISAAFYGDKDIKMDHFIFHDIFQNKKNLTLLAFFISSTVGNIFSISYISEIKPWDTLIFVYCTVFNFLKLRDTCQSVLQHALKFVDWNIFSQLRKRKLPGLQIKQVFLNYFFFWRNNHILTKVMTSSFLFLSSWVFRLFLFLKRYNFSMPV